MSVTAVTHLNFHGQAREALEFYRSVFGGRSVVATYGDFGMPAGLPDTDRVVFGQIEADNGFRVMAYDVPTSAEGPAGAPGGSNTRRENGLTITDAPFFV